MCWARARPGFEGLLTHTTCYRNHILLQRCSDLDSPFKEVETLHNLFLRDRNKTVRCIATVPVVRAISESLDSTIKEVTSLKRTSALSIQHHTYVEHLRLFIHAERTGSWALQLDELKKMIPHSQAGGRLHYARAAHLYVVQESLDLETRISLEEFLKFTGSGHFTIRRTHEFWSCIRSDQVIEEDRTRPFKSQGGLPRGRGITESTLTLHPRFPGMHEAVRCAGGALWNSFSHF